MQNLMDNISLREALMNRGFEDITSPSRDSKSWRLKHPKMTNFVSIKRRPDAAVPMSTSPLVVHANDARCVLEHVPPIAGVSVSREPFGGGSTKYPGKVPGLDVAVADVRALDQLVACMMRQLPSKPTGSLVVASAESDSADDEPDVPPTWLGRAAELEINGDPSSRDVSATMRKALVNARLGQGGYRSRMLDIWAGRCAVSSCGEQAALIASHAKPWSECTNVERLDAFNGLLLSASIDRLFDRGLISFADDGRMLRRGDLAEEDLAALGIGPDARLRSVRAAHLPYLAAHRKRFRFE